MSILNISMSEVYEKYETILFDAFGVLMNAQEALPYAVNLINKMNREKKDYIILSNGSSSSCKTTMKKYHDKGLEIPLDKIITSGSLIKSWFKSNNLLNEKCYVLGPKSSKDLVESFGGLVVSPKSKDFETLIVCNQDGFIFPDDIDHVISVIFNKIENKETIRMLLPNPDLIYPSANHQFGITSGSIAVLIEHALKIKFPNQDFVFEKLGKPYAPIFEAAYKKSKTKKMVLIGDQVQTDILGANNYGIDSVLIGTGLTNINEPLQFSSDFKPTFIMNNLKT